MALLFIDSFDHYPVGDLPLKWTTQGPTVSLSSGSGRRSSTCFRSTNSNGWIGKAVTPGDNTFVVGIALKIGALPSAGTNGEIIRIADSNGVFHTCLEVNSSGLLQVIRGSSSAGTRALLGSAVSGNLSSGVYYYIEFKGLISDSVGTLEAKINGVSYVSVSGQDTRQNTGLTSWGLVYFRPGDMSGTNDMDDVYICDGTTGFNNDFLGDVRVDASFAIANGANNGSTPSTGTDRYATIDESSENGDTDYNTLTAASQKDTLDFQSLAATGGTIKGFQVTVVGRKTDSGAATIRPLVRHSGTDYTGTSAGLSTSYSFSVIQPYDTNPGTSAAITESEFNAAEFGYERTA
jgi:hypothetical protein